MSHQAVIYGVIEGATYTTGDYRRLQEHNAKVISTLPDTDEWPWLVKAMFALPAPYPEGTFQDQIIHFGASFKDDPYDRSCWDEWFEKFERLLQRMFWYSATVVLETDFEPDRKFQWIPDDQACEKMVSANPQPISSWSKTVSNVESNAT